MVEAISASTVQKGLYDQTSADSVADMIKNSSKDDAKVAEGVGKAYDKAYKAFLDAADKGDAGGIAKAQAVLQKASLVFQTFTQMISNTFQIMLGVVRQMSVR